LYRYLKNVFKIEGEIEPEDDSEFEDMDESEDE